MKLRDLIAEKLKILGGKAVKNTARDYKLKSKAEQKADDAEMMEEFRKIDPDRPIPREHKKPVVKEDKKPVADEPSQPVVKQESPEAEDVVVPQTAAKTDVPEELVPEQAVIEDLKADPNVSKGTVAVEEAALQADVDAQKALDDVDAERALDETAQVDDPAVGGREAAFQRNNGQVVAKNIENTPQASEVEMLADNKLDDILSHEPLDGDVNVNRTEARNFNILGQVSEKSIADEFRRMEKELSPSNQKPQLDDFSPEAQEDLILLNFVDRVQETKPVERTSVTWNESTKQAERKLGITAVKWLDGEKADPKSPINDLNHDYIQNPNTKKAKAWRRLNIEARNATVDLARLLESDNPLTKKLIAPHGEKGMSVTVHSQRIVLSLQSKALYEEALRLMKLPEILTADRYNFRKGISNFLAMTQSISSRAAEAARTLNQFNIPVGSDDFRMGEMKRIMEHLDGIMRKEGLIGGIGSTEQLIAFMAASGGDLKSAYKMAEKYSASNVTDGLYEMYVANIFMDLAIHKYNAIGSAVNTAAHLGGAYAGGVLGSIKSAFSKKTKTDNASWGEARAYHYGLNSIFTQFHTNAAKGFLVGFRNGQEKVGGNLVSGVAHGVPDARFFDTGAPSVGTPMLPMFLRGGAIDAGFELYAKLFVRGARGMISSVDQVYREAHRQAEANRLIYRLLVNEEQLKPYSLEFNRRARDIAMGEDGNHSKRIHDEALEYARMIVFQNRTNSLPMQAVRVANQIPMVRYMTMFAQTIDNMLATTLEFSALAPLFNRYKVASDKGGAYRDLAQAKFGMGVMFLSFEIYHQLQNIQEVPGDGSRIMYSKVNTGIDKTYAQKKLMKDMGNPVGTMSFPRYHNDPEKENYDEFSGVYFNIDLARIGSIAHTYLLTAILTEAAFFARDAEGAKSVMSSIAMVVGSIMSDYSAAGGFSTISGMLSNRIDPSDMYVDLLGGIAPIASGGTRFFAQRQDGGNVSRNSTLNMTGATSVEKYGWDGSMEGFIESVMNPTQFTESMMAQKIGLGQQVKMVRMSDQAYETARVIDEAVRTYSLIFQDLNMVIPSVVMEMFKVMNPFTGERLAGNSALSPRVDPLGHVSVSNSPAASGLSDIDLDEHIAEHEPRTPNTKKLYAEYRKLEYALEDLDVVISYRYVSEEIPDGYTIDISLDTVDKRIIDQKRLAGDPTWEVDSPQATYTNYAFYVGAMMEEDMFALVLDEEPSRRMIDKFRTYQDQPDRKAGHTNKYLMLTDQRSKTIELGKESWLKDNPDIVEILDAHARYELSLPPKDRVLRDPPARKGGRTKEQKLKEKSAARQRNRRSTQKKVPQIGK